MPRAVSIHLVAMAVLIGSTAFVLRLLGPALPPMQRALVVATTAAYVLVWLGMLSLRLSPNMRVRSAQSWRSHDRAIMWLGNCVTAVSFWVQMPFADEALRLMVVIFLFGPVTVEVMGTIERPPARSSMALAPLALPLATAAFYLVHWGPYSPAILLFTPAYAFVVMSMRRIIQGAVDRTFQARAAAEAALVKVAAERDAKTRFLASASHDLGQPLQAARLFFDQAMRAQDPVTRARAAARVGWAFDTTEELLRRILDHLRLESGGVEARVQQLAVGPLVARIAEMNEPLARIANVDLRAMPSRLEAQGDPALVERALGNLVGNAIRHAKGRRILVGARRLAGRVRLWVIDDGVGVKDADAERLFDDYVQGSNHGDEIRGGFGLGLASARRMAGLMDASVGLERKWANGSAFWLELPAAEPKAG